MFFIGDGYEVITNPMFSGFSSNLVIDPLILVIGSGFLFSSGNRNCVGSIQFFCNHRPDYNCQFSYRCN